MSWTGEPGDEGEARMMTAEIISNMARLSLTGKLSLAISEYRSLGQWCFVFVPYYEWNPAATAEDILPLISVRSFAARCETLLERELTVLLKITRR